MPPAPAPAESRPAPAGGGKRIVQITDWLPPQFSAVSQYAFAIAAEEIAKGNEFGVVGLTPDGRVEAVEGVRMVAARRARYDKKSWLRRLAWTLRTNVILLRHGWGMLRWSDEIRFTGSPPFLIFFLYPANWLLRKELVYRITDFYPECIMAALSRPSRSLEFARRVTNVLRRRIDRFEVLGEDMAERLAECGVPRSRMVMRRDASPVEVLPSTQPIPRPPGLAGKRAILYSGNWGAAHEVDTFFEAYRLHHERGSGTLTLWLNATGTGADDLDARLKAAGLPYVRERLVPLEQLAGLLVTPDIHLITLRPSFTGYVLPSKVFGCIASGRPVLFIGSRRSDVHLLCTAAPGLPYRHVDIGDVEGVAAALDGFPWSDSADDAPEGSQPAGWSRLNGAARPGEASPRPA